MHDHLSPRPPFRRDGSVLLRGSRRKLSYGPKTIFFKNILPAADLKYTSLANAAFLEGKLSQYNKPGFCIRPYFHSQQAAQKNVVSNATQ